ncbi:D-amino acid dehydrogenase 2 [Rhodovastum atsumiense]|uniref:D-amino acid dehydrogenase n=1 Tax=Rhodovastum atsumiense TaxID=504468 RepID=A0A5M6IZ91_9PROT|nr:D-amino acid dehydrogenase [Rhodovastum atsumiense]KAA5613652.1 D-amino acid dehydrogenase [Rhodovastum atsumiense]CAH2599560.1 D-amino acid dehydrogenase 2 [Rhodovastum atsumiense]
MRIIVVGAGIVGLASAYFLARDGHAVTVIDQETKVGRGTSFANGGQLSYSYVAPMAAPSVLRSLPKYLLQRDSPVCFQPSADPGQWAWLLRFLRACNAEAGALATAKLLALSFHSRDMLHALIAETGVRFLHARNGKLVVQSSRESQEEAELQMRLQATLGCEQQALTAEECLALEPGLASIRDRLVGGIYTPSEEVGDCRTLCQELERVLSAPSFGVTFALGTIVQRIEVVDGRVALLQTSLGPMQADLYVLAAGAGSRALGRSAGVRLAVQPIRGYSISARIRDGNRAPVRSITDTARKTVYAPIGDKLRAAGFAEVTSDRSELRPRRISTLLDDLQKTFPGACELEDVEPWSGLRPATPTGLPVIGPSPTANLLLNVGQGSLGFTLAAGSGKLLADIVAGRTPAIRAADYAMPGTHH